MRHFSKILCIGLVLVSFGSLSLFAAGQQDTETTESAVSAEFENFDNSWEIDTSPVTLSIYVDVDRDWGKFWGDDLVSQKIMEDTGVTLDYMICSKPIEQLRLLIASGDLPDIVQAQGVVESPEIIELAKRDQVWDLMELSDKYAPSFMRRVYERGPHVLLAHRIAFDTKRMYASRSMYVPYDKLDSSIVMRNKEGISVVKQLWESIGSPKATTAAGYIDMLRAIKAKYPDMIPVQSHRNPPKDESPMVVTASLPIAGLAQKYFMMGDTVIRFWEHPNFVELLKFTNTLYTEKLLNQAEFTQGKSQLKANVRNGNVFSQIMSDSDQIDTWSQKFLQKVQPDWYFMMIEPVTIDPSTMEYTGDSIFGGAGLNPIMISKNAKNPARAIRFLDYVNSDYFQKLQKFGDQGTHHILNEDGYPSYTDLVRNTDVSEAAAKFGFSNYWMFRQEWYAQLEVFYDATEIGRDAIRIASEHYQDLSFLQGIGVIPPEADEVKTFANVADYYSQAVMGIITGDPADVEDGYKVMLARMRELGLDELNAYYTKQWNEKAELIDSYKLELTQYLD